MAELALASIQTCYEQAKGAVLALELVILSGDSSSSVNVFLQSQVLTRVGLLITGIICMLLSVLFIDVRIPCKYDDCLLGNVFS